MISSKSMRGKECQVGDVHCCMVPIRSTHLFGQAASRLRKPGKEIQDEKMREEEGYIYTECCIRLLELMGG